MCWQLVVFLRSNISIPDHTMGLPRPHRTQYPAVAKGDFLELQICGSATPDRGVFGEVNGFTFASIKKTAALIRKAQHSMGGLSTF